MSSSLFPSRGPSHPRSLNLRGSHDALLKPDRAKSQKARAELETRPFGSTQDRQAWMRERQQRIRNIGSSKRQKGTNEC